jgi:hypothetical protein
MAIIALTGRAGSGKDTVASIVQELYPELNCQIKGFADKLRQVASLLTGIPAEEMKKQEVKALEGGPEWDNMTLRTFLQKLGTDAIRDGLHANSWCNALMCDYNPLHEENHFQKLARIQGLPDVLQYHPEYPNWLITDCRFPNELEAIASRSGICIRIVRPDNPYPVSNHQSETALDGVELLTITNDGSLDKLKLRVQEIFDPIVNRIRSGGTGVG